MNVTVKTIKNSQLISQILGIALLTFLSGVFLFFSIKSIFTRQFEFEYILGILIGLSLLSLITFLILSFEKKIIFHHEEVEIYLVKKTLSINYKEIQYIKFVHPPKSYEYLLLRLVKRKFGRKNYIISTKNNKNDLLLILNHCRKMDVQTGLNEIGEKYFTFRSREGKYVFREDKKIDISKLW